MLLFQKPKYLDVLVLSVFTVLITLHPYYLHGQMNLFELGLYLPGINAILDGSIPYRDFFYLRGPFELYMPAFLMQLFGENVAVLSSYFYVGTIIGLLCCVVLGKQMFSSRLFFYLAIPVLIARTFPRVVFTYWGGMRFALGLIVITCAVQYFKSKKSIWIFISGIIAAYSFWISLEIGVFVFVAVVFTLTFCAVFKLLTKDDLITSFCRFLIGFLIVTLPYCIYLQINGALIPFFETISTVVQNMENIFPQVEVVPKNLLEAITSMFNPGSKNFRHLTPAYLYVFLAIYYCFQIKNKQLQLKDAAVICLAVYGFVFYVGSFRNIWSSNFEMFLQPEKILLFVLLERIFFILKDKKAFIIQEIKGMDASLFIQRLKVWSINIFIGGVIFSSIGYPINRLNKRFFAFKYVRNKIIGKETNSLIPIHDQKKVKLNLERVKGLTVPEWQAKDFIELTRFINEHTSSKDAVLMYPEGAAYSFIVDRPFVGRFPMANFSWFNEDSHKEYLASLAETQAKFAVIPKELPHYFDKTHFIVKANKQKYDEVMRYIEKNYELAATTSTLKIFQWRNSNE